MVKVVNHEERRSTIAQAAITIISEDGLELASLRNIASRAGVTTGAIAHYFEDKDALLEAALYEVGRLLFGKKSGTSGKRLLSYTEVLPTNPVSQQYWRVWLAFCGHAGSSEKLQKVYKKFYLDIEDAVTENLKIKDKKRAREVAASIIAAVDGVGLCATVQPELWSPARQKARLNELLAPFFSQSLSKDI